MSHEASSSPAPKSIVKSAGTEYCLICQYPSAGAGSGYFAIKFIDSDLVARRDEKRQGPRLREGVRSAGLVRVGSDGSGFAPSTASWPVYR